MLTFLARRAAATIPLLLAVSFLTFLLVDLAPGDFLSILAENPKVSGETIERYRSAYGLDRPFPVRYARWLGHVVQGDFGWSFQYGRPVTGLILERMGNTLLLAVTALVAGWGLALPLGVASAVRPYSWIDKACGLFAYAGLSIPAVFLSLLMLLFAYSTQLFPIGGTVSLYHDRLSLAGKLQDRLWHLALPAAVLAFTSMAGYMRQMRSSMLETLQQDFIRTARAKGLGRRRVTWKHGFVNAVNPLITLFGYSLAFLLNGSFLVEVVMNWPGMARLTVDAVQKQDEPLVMASVMMASLLLVLGNLVADVLLAVSDPRIRLETQ